MLNEKSQLINHFEAHFTFFRR